MEFTSSEEALVLAALSSHKFRLKRQLNLFRKGRDDVLRDAAEREINAADALESKILGVGLDNRCRAGDTVNF
jgi:hypothetical protein